MCCGPHNELAVHQKSCVDYEDQNMRCVFLIDGVVHCPRSSRMTNPSSDEHIRCVWLRELGLYSGCVFLIRYVAIVLSACSLQSGHEHCIMLVLCVCLCECVCVCVCAPVCPAYRLTKTTIPFVNL